MSTQRVSQDKGRFENWKRILAIIRERLPSREDLILVLSACVFLIHLWAYLAMLEAIPAWLMRMNLSDLAVTISYVLVFALFESLIIWFGLVFIAWILPGTWICQRFATRGVALFSIISLFFAGLQLSNFTIEDAPNMFVVPGTIVIMVTTLVITILAERYRKLEDVFLTILRRLVVLSAFYFLADLIALGAVMLRNFIL